MRREEKRRKLREAIPIAALFVFALVAAHYAGLFEGKLVDYWGPAISGKESKWIAGALQTIFLIAPLAIITVRRSFSTGRKTAIVIISVCVWMFVFGLHASQYTGVVADVVGVATLFGIIAQGFEKKAEA